MNHYSSCLDSAFLPRGLALYRSLIRHAKPFRWWVLCLDDDAHQGLSALALEDIVPVHQSDVLDSDLSRLRQDRSRREYYFACKPWLYAHVFASDSSAYRVTYLDGDLFFFSSPKPVHNQIAGSSVALSPHRSGRDRWESLFGFYNAGWSSFANDDVGAEALSWWRDRCIEATPDYPTDGLFADQKYLQQMPRRFDRVATVTNKGLNLAPWNAATSTPFELVDGRVFAGGDPLVCFHFHGLSRISKGMYDPGWLPRGDTRLLRSAVYEPYLMDLADTEKVAEDVLGRPVGQLAPWGGTRPRPWWWRRTRSLVSIGGGMVTGRFISIQA